MEQHDSRGMEIIPGLFYFLCAPEGFNPKSTPAHAYFSTANALIYTAFFADFGPLDLGMTYQFCQDLDAKLKEMEKGGTKGCVTYYCSNHGHQRANSAVLIMAYLIFVRDYTAEQAYLPFYGIQPPLTTFRDAAFCVNTFPCTALDCARAFARAHHWRHFVYSEFSLPNFQKYSKLQHGDFSWIIPGKLVAFSGPLAKRRVLSEGVYSLRPEEYIPIMKTLGITCIVRFNSKCYERNVYLNAGIRHVDLYYEDGGNPTDAILQSFLAVCESESGAVAVHCKAGLGRTGTNIAAYMIKHYGYTAKETIAWCRVCRPGSVVGPQQQYLMSIEARMRLEGEAMRDRANRGAHNQQQRSNGFSPINTSASATGKLTPPIGPTASSGLGALFNTRDKLSKLEITGGTSSLGSGSNKSDVRPNTSSGVVRNGFQHPIRGDRSVRITNETPEQRPISGNGSVTRRTSNSSGKVITPRLMNNSHNSSLSVVTSSGMSGMNNRQKTKEGFATPSTGYANLKDNISVSQSYNGGHGYGSKHSHDGQRPSTSAGAGTHKASYQASHSHAHGRSGGRNNRYG